MSINHQQLLSNLSNYLAKQLTAGVFIPYQKLIHALSLEAEALDEKAKHEDVAEDQWARHPEYSMETWGAEAAAGETTLSYWQWVVAQIEQEDEDQDEDDD